MIQRLAATPLERHHGCDLRDERVCFRPSPVAAFDRGQLAESTLRQMERLQGTHIDPELDEEPGRIIYQSQRGPLARLGMNPHTRYYADYASPFDFIFAFAHAYALDWRPAHHRMALGGGPAHSGLGAGLRRQ